MTNRCYDPECFNDEHATTTEHNFGLDQTGRSGVLSDYDEDTSPEALAAWEVYSTIPANPWATEMTHEERRQDAFTAGFDAAANRVKNRVNGYAYDSQPGPAVSALAVLDSIGGVALESQVDGRVEP